MATLNLSNPDKPSFSYLSDGTRVNFERDCGCTHGSGYDDCIEDCHAKAQEALDACLELFPEDA